MTHRLPTYAAALALLALAACGADEPAPTPPSASGPGDSSSGSSSGSVEPLDWRPVDGPVDDTVTRNEEWTLTVTGGGSGWELAGPTTAGGTAESGWRVGEALLDEDWAVAVLQDEAERRPSRATVVHLESGRSFAVDGRSDVPTTTGGTWALGDDRLLHATVDAGAYCLAEVDLETERSRIAWCAPKRHGFTSAHASDDGDSLMTFDDARPSCRTVATVADGAVTPFPGVTECKGWEGVRTDDGAVWSEIPRERRIEEADFHARVGESYVDLGPGLAGSLVECDGAAYFVRDPRRQGQPAALLRWTATDGTVVVYESPRGQAFLEPPRCGGDAITITARSSAGDEQVTADLD